jgi:beta-N-acetylhexosaminidase
MMRLLELAAAALAAALAWNVRNPLLAGYRPWPLVAALLIAALVLLTVRQGMRRGAHEPGAGIGRLLTAALAALAVLLCVAVEGRQLESRLVVSAAEPLRMAQLGRHLIVGYRDVNEARRLIEMRAVGGFYIAQPNVAGRSVEEVRQEIAGLQALAKANGLPALWIVTDQEGGLVQRVTPPLGSEPGLRDIIAGQHSRARAVAVEQFASRQGHALADLGVNLNLAPVTDLDFSIGEASGRYTRLSERVIAADPDVVASVASRYCAGLAEARVHCTLKHFPGLGRVRGDTHLRSVRLDTSLSELEATDWVPFRRVLPLPSAVLMMGHVRLTALDPDRPASLSKRVIGSLIREQWGHDGLVITDDLCMGAVANGPRAIGEAALAALNAGADLLLVSWDGEQIYPILAALLDADRNGRIEIGVLPKSAQRLDAGLARAARTRETQ